MYASFALRASTIHCFSIYFILYTPYAILLFMSWASRRRTFYILGIVLFFMVTVGIPAAIFLYKPPTCFDGKQNQEETAVDKGGPCLLLDERTLVPHAVVWSRSFEVRDGTYSAVAYIENPN